MTISPTHARDIGPNLGAEVPRLSAAPAVVRAIHEAQLRGKGQQQSVATERDEPARSEPAKDAATPVAALPVKPNEPDAAQREQARMQAHGAEMARAYEGNLEIRLIRAGADRGDVQTASVDQKERALFDKDAGDISLAALGNMGRPPEFVAPERGAGAEMLRS